MEGQSWDLLEFGMIGRQIGLGKQELSMLSLLKIEQQTMIELDHIIPS